MQTTGLEGIYTATTFTGVTPEVFQEKMKAFSDEMEYGDDNLEVTDPLRVEMDYRDSANYRIGIAFALDGQGQVWVQEPDWYEDEEDERELFFNRIEELFSASN